MAVFVAVMALFMASHAFSWPGKAVVGAGVTCGVKLPPRPLRVKVPPRPLGVKFPPPRPLEGFFIPLPEKLKTKLKTLIILLKYP